LTPEACEASRRWQPPCEPTNNFTSKPCSRGFSQSPMRPAPARRERLDQRLAACALVEEFDVEVVLGVDAFRDAESKRRVARGDLSPGEPDLWRRRSDRWRKDLPAQHASCRGDPDGAESLQKRSSGRLNSGCDFIAHGTPFR